MYCLSAEAGLGLSMGLSKSNLLVPAQGIQRNVCNTNKRLIINSHHQ